MLAVAAAAAEAIGGEDLVALDVSDPLPLVDIFLLVTGRSERNVAAIADEVEEKITERMAYERVIPIVDITARLVSSALSHHG